MKWQSIVTHRHKFYRKAFLNRLTPNDPYMGRTAPLTSKRCILYIYSTNVGTEYFKHVLYSPFFSLQNAVCFIMLTCLVPILFTFYIHGVLKLKKKIIIPASKCDQHTSTQFIYENIKTSNFFFWTQNFDRRCLFNPAV